MPLSYFLSSLSTIRLSKTFDLHYDTNYICSVLSNSTVFGFSHGSKYCCSVAKLHLTLCDIIDYSTPGFPVFHYLLEFAQTHVHRVGDAIQSSHPLLSPSPPALKNLSQDQSLCQWVFSSHQVAKVLELQLQHQSFQWIFRVDFF